MTANFGIRIIDAIIEFCCDNLNDLAVMSIKDLDIVIANLRKTMSGLPANRRDRLNISKCIFLHASSLHFYNRSLCATPLQPADIAALVADYISAMKTNYAVSTLGQATTGLGDVKLPKMIHLKWPEFKSSLNELLGQLFGQNRTLLLYVICDNEAGDFDEAYNNRRSKLNLCIPHNGPSFKDDNGDVFSILLQHT